MSNQKHWLKYIEVTVLICCSPEDIGMSELLLTGAYKVVKKIPGRVTKEFGMTFDDPVTISIFEDGYYYVIYEVRSPAYLHPLYYGVLQDSGMLMFWGYTLTVNPPGEIKP